MAKASKKISQQEQNVLSVVSISTIIILPSKNNPRKSINEDSIRELANSMELNGLLQPITIRPDADGYEIVAGERRWRAAKLLEWETIPAIIRQVSDEDMLEIQVLENLQREDMSPLDEAMAFQTLLKKESIDWLSSKIHKSKKYVLDRIKLNDLCLEAKLHLTTGVLPLGHAVLLSKIKEEDQGKILKGIISIPYNEKSQKDSSLAFCYKTLSDLKYLINNTFTTFTSAPFSLSNDNLIEGIPSCNDCEKRTCNQNLLFNDITENDVCTDPICFKSKSDTHIANLLKELKEKHGKAYSAEWDNYGSSSHNIKANGQKLMMLDKPFEGSVPVVITKSSNGWHSEKVGKVGYVIMPDKEEIEKVKEEKKEQSSGNSMTWEQRQKNKFDIVIKPRIKIMADYYNSKNLETTKGFTKQLIFSYFKSLGDNELAAMLVEFGALQLENAEYETIDNVDQEVIYAHLHAFIIGNKCNTEMLVIIALMLNKVEDTSEEDSEEFEEPSWNQITKTLGILK